MLPTQHPPGLEVGMKFFTVFDFIRPAMEASKIMAEAQVVIGLRVAGRERLDGVGKEGRQRGCGRGCDALGLGGGKFAGYRDCGDAPRARQDQIQCAAVKPKGTGSEGMKAVLCGLAVLVAGSAQAQDVDCAVAETQQEMNFCAEADWQETDVGLNAAYAKAMILMENIDAELATEDQGAALTLRNAQRSWVEFRDAACAAEAYMMHGGSAEPLLTYGCMARLTTARAADLEQLSQTY